MKNSIFSNSMPSKVILSLILVVLVTGKTFAEIKNIEVPATGEYAQIDTSLFKETLAKINEGGNKAQEAINAFKRNPEKYIPPTFYLVGIYLFNEGEKNEGVSWLLKGELRGKFDANRCADISARSATGIFYNKVPPDMKDYIRWLLTQERLMQMVNEAIDWDRNTPYQYDERWINLHGISALRSDLRGEANNDVVFSLPKEEWPQIAEKTRQEYLKKFEDSQRIAKNAELKTNESLESVDRIKGLLTFASKMNIFRLSAGALIDRSIEVWANKEFQEKWQREVVPMFSKESNFTLLPEKTEKVMLQDFFSSAIVFVGRADKEKAVVLFYNPWVDGLLFVSTQDAADKPILTDFRFVSGESWREEIPQAVNDPLDLYSPKEPLTIALARKYNVTVSKFNTLYPLQAPFIFIPTEISSSIGSAEEELSRIKKRMLYRMNMFTQLFTNENKAFLKVARDLRLLLMAADCNKLKEYLSSGQNPKMLETICIMPAALRHNLSPNYFIKNESTLSSLIALVNSETPRWFFVAKIIDKPSPEKPEVTIEVMDFETASQVIDASTTKPGI